MNDKDIALNAIRGLPADATFEEIRDRIDFLVAVRTAEESVERGEVIPHEDVEREFAAWIKSAHTKYSGPTRPSAT